MLYLGVTQQKYSKFVYDIVCRYCVLKGQRWEVEFLLRTDHDVGKMVENVLQPTTNFVAHNCRYVTYLPTAFKLNVQPFFKNWAGNSQPLSLSFSSLT